MTVRVCGSDGRCGTDDVTVRTGVSQRVVPTASCVTDLGAQAPARYVAAWGYSNPAPFAIYAPTVPLLDNTFNSAPFFRGQPQVFLPGNRSSVFTSSFTGGTSKWSLQGRTASASAATARC